VSQAIPAWVDGALAPVDKLDVHRRGLRHPAISVFVTEAAAADGPRVLLQRRAEAKYHTPGLWANACCTHPHWGEAPEACAARRLGEELGIADLPLTHRGTIEYRAEVGGGLTEHEVVELFVAAAPVGLTLAPDPDEVAETRWMPLTELTRDAARRPALYTPWLRIYLAQHLDAIFGARA
jgi:isopentenyl-diphosphate delta-isomerase